MILYTAKLTKYLNKRKESHPMKIINLIKKLQNFPIRVTSPISILCDKKNQDEFIHIY